MSHTRKCFLLKRFRRVVFTCSVHGSLIYPLNNCNRFITIISFFLHAQLFRVIPTITIPFYITIQIRNISYLKWDCTYNPWTCQPWGISWIGSIDIDSCSIESPNIFRLSGIGIRFVFEYSAWRIPALNKQIRHTY